MLARKMSPVDAIRTGQTGERFRNSSGHTGLRDSRGGGIRSSGEGSSGIFFSGQPGLRISERLDELADGAYIPELKVRVWLKPFDLGVSQDVEIELGTDPETREYIARMTITRLSGTLESWYRLNKPFVTAVRRQFLHWRAVGDGQKAALFDKARALLQSAQR